MLIIKPPVKSLKVKARYYIGEISKESESKYRHRRAYLDDLRDQKVMSYLQSLALASSLLGKVVTEYGQLTLAELHTVTKFITRDYRGFNSNEYLGTYREAKRD